MSDPVEVDRSNLKTALTLVVLKPHRSESSDYLDGPEYCYPEVEPKFDPDEIAALFGRASPNLPRKPQNEPMYHPPPQFDPKDLVPKKSPVLPKPGLPRKTPDFPKGCSLPVGIHNGAVRHGGSPLKPIKPLPGLSPVLPFNPNVIPVVPSRAGKPSLAADTSSSTARSPNTKRKPLPRPSPVQKNTFHSISTYGASSRGTVPCNFANVFSFILAPLHRIFRSQKVIGPKFRTSKRFLFFSFPIRLSSALP